MREIDRKRHVSGAVVSALAAGALLLGAGPAGAQQGAVAGEVTEAGTLEPIGGTQVFLVDTQHGTLTDGEGNFRIEGVPAGQYEVRARILGYRVESQTVRVDAGETANVDFELALSAVELGEVTVNVVTGAQRERRQLGTNTGRINAEEVNRGPVNSFQNLLQGRSEGVTLQSVTGTTGTGQRIRIRGAGSISLSNEPLIFLDGVRISGGSTGLEAGFTGGQDISPLNNLNPEDIESIEVLKGPAATSQYGTAASNGVLLITTRSGASAAGVDWRTYAETGAIHDIAEYPDNVLAFQNLDPDNVTGLGGENPQYFITFDDGGATPDGRSEIANPVLEPCTNFEAAAGECSQDLTFRHNSLDDPRTSPLQRGTRQRFGGTVARTGEDVSFYLSGDWEEETNVLSNNSLEKFSATANVNTQAIERADINFRTKWVTSNLTLPNNDNSLFSPLINGLLAAPAFIPGDGGLVFTDEPFRGTQASWAHYGFFFTPDELTNITSATNTDRFILGSDGSFRITDWMSARYNLGTDMNTEDDRVTLFEGMGNIGGSFDLGFRNRATGQRNTWTASVSLEGDFDLTENVTSSTVVGGAFDQEDLEVTECFGAGLAGGVPLASCSATTSLFSVSETFSKIRSVAGFLNQEFGINDRLYVTGTVRVDDNSAFGGGDVRLQAFPGANASWVASDEPFFPDSDVISELRVRAAVGWAGNRPSFRDALTLFSPVAVGIGGSNETAATISSTGNPDLDPERVREAEGGFDAGLFSDRLNLTFTYYDRRATDALISRQLPPSFGLTGSVFENIGEIKNTGLEITLDGQALETEPLGLGFNVQFTTNDNEIVELGEGVEPIVFDPQAHKEGFPAGAYHQDRFEFEDPDGDGLLRLDDVRISSDSAVFIDESQPTWTVSFGSNVRVFDFLNVSGQAEARGGHSQMNFTESFRCQRGFTSDLRPTACEGVGDPNASLSEQARFIAAFDKGSSTGYIEDATFLKIREVAAQVYPPGSIVENAPWLEGASVTFSARNLATITGYSGIDPEINFTGGTANFGQAEFNTQPPPQILTVRLDYRF